MSDFHKQYMVLLRKQVDQEISFLISNGHNSDQITLPCMFCVQHQHGYYYCRRLNDLRQFQSTIISHNQMGRELFRDKPVERRKIGTAITENVHQQIMPMGTNLESGQMPLLSIQL